MARATVSRLFSAAWLVLLSAGCAGGLTFMIIATGLDRIEAWADKHVKEIEE